MLLLLLGWALFCGVLLSIYHFCLARRTKQGKLHSKSAQKREWPSSAFLGNLEGPMVIEGAKVDAVNNAGCELGIESRQRQTASATPGGNNGRNIQHLTLQPQTEVQTDTDVLVRGAAGELQPRQQLPPACNQFKHGQGPFRFRLPSNEVNHSQQQPSTSHQAQQHQQLSNAALTSFFSQFLSNLGVNLGNGNIFIFAEQDHNIVWLHLGPDATEGLYAVHEYNLDDQVTELLEKFSVLFVTEGLLPSELEQMPRLAVPAEIIEKKQSCNICMDHFHGGQKITELGCLHLYHSDCIHAWLLSRNTCPTCRAVVFFDDQQKTAKKMAGVFA